MDKDAATDRAGLSCSALAAAMQAACTGSQARLLWRSTIVMGCCNNEWRSPINVPAASSTADHGVCCCGFAGIFIKVPGCAAVPKWCIAAVQAQCDRCRCMQCSIQGLAPAAVPEPQCSERAQGLRQGSCCFHRGLVMSCNADGLPLGISAVTDISCIRI